MQRSIVCRLFLVFVLIAAGRARAPAATARPVTLEVLCKHADRILLGDVLSAKNETLLVGRRRIPVVTYRIRVVDALKGKLGEDPGSREVEMQLPARPGAAPSGSGILTYIPGAPRLETGNRYLLLVAPPSALGCSLTVGLGQGCFRVIGSGESAAALNEFGNAGLLETDRHEQPRRGPIRYSRLAERIRETVRKEAGE